MKRSGKASLLTILLTSAGIVGVIAIALFFIFGGESPSGAASRFMVALAKGDYKALTDLSLVGESDRSKLEEQWKYATQVAAPHYFFTWRVVSESRQSADSAAVTVMVTRNARPNNPGSFEEKFGIPLVRKNGQWLVDVRGLARPMYPSLPR